MVAGWQIRLSTPPRDSARVKHSSPDRKSLHRRFAAGQFEAQHRAEAALLPPCNLMAGMIRKARVVHARDARMSVQEIHHRRRILGVHAHARMQAAPPRAAS